MRPLIVNAANGVLANDSNDGPLTAILQDDVVSGLLNLNADGSFAYTPSLDFTGTDSFTYRRERRGRGLPGDGDDRCRRDVDGRG